MLRRWDQCGHRRAQLLPLRTLLFRATLLPRFLLLCLPLFLLLFAGTVQPALAASFGTPELESALGERLRVVLPIVGPVKEPLSVDCIKLNASASEPYDVSNLVRASLIQRGNGQAVVLTTAQTMNDVAVSFEAGIGCGIHFSRRYTLLLDMARERPVGAIAAANTAASATPTASAADAATVPLTAPTTATPITPSRRLRPRGDGITAPAAVDPGAAAKPASVIRRVRPEDEPGVLPRSRGGTAKALAPPVRSLLKIDLGGIGDFLADPTRSPLEQSTGMRLSGELGGNARPAAAAAADVEFKQAHARFLASLRDKPDPVSQENEALARRLDAVAKDIASLKVELQASAARAKELEASRVSWWWLLVAALLSAAVAAGLVLALRKPQPRQLILIDPEQKSGPGSTHAPPPKPAARGQQLDESSAIITETYAMSGRLRPPDDRQGVQEVGLAGDVAGDVAARSSAALAVVPAFDLPAATVPPTVQFENAKPTAGSQPAPGSDQKTAASDNAIKYSGPIAAVRAAIKATDDAVLRIIPSPAVMALKPDKNSLTQQLEAMDPLADESWASYRPPMDADGVALPFGAPAAPGSRPAANLVPIEDDDDASHGTSIELNFDLDAEMVEYTKAASQSQPGALDFDPAAAAADVVQGSAVSVDAADRAKPAGGSGAPISGPGDLLSFDFDDPTLDPNRTEVLPVRDPSAAMAYQTNMPSSDQAIMMQVLMATASSVMEATQRQWDAMGASAALKLLVPYLQLAPANTPPGPWVMLAHVLLRENLEAEYLTVEETFRERFGASLPDWQTAGTLADAQLGLARVPGLEIVAASQRGTSMLVGRLAGLAYRVDAPAEVLFDLQFHRQVLLLAAECTLDETQSAPDMDLAL